MHLPRSVLLSVALPGGIFGWLLGCAGHPGIRIPAELHAIPGTEPALDESVEAARQMFERGGHKEALAAVEELLGLQPGHVDAHRVRQEILRSRGRLGLLAYEAEKRVRTNPGSATSHYLHGRIQEDDRRKQASFLRTIHLDPAFFWGWFGLAFVKRRADPATANRIYARLYRLSKAHRLVAIAYAASLRQGPSRQKALRVYQRLQSRAPGLSSLGLAQAYLAAGSPRRAWPHVLKALELRPFDASVHDLVRRYVGRGLTDDRAQELLDVLRQDRERLERFGEEGARPLAALFHRAGDFHAALEVLRGSPRRHTPGSRRLLHELLLATGDVAGFLRDVMRSFPKPLLDDETNQVRGVWVSLLRGPWMTRPDPVDTPAHGLELVRSLRDVGMLPQADRIATIAILRHGGGDKDPLSKLRECRELRDEVRKEIAFEAALRRKITGQYTFFTKSRQVPQDLPYFLRDLRELSMRILGRDVVGKPTTFQVPFVGRLLDSFTGDLGEHLARYNKHLVLGQRNGRPVEGMLLTRISLKVVDPGPDLPLPAHCREVIGQDREISPLLQHDLAGIALLNHYVVDMDQVRSWALTIQEQRDIVREDGNVLLRDPLPEAPDQEEPLGVEWRLGMLSPVEDSDLEMAVLDLIRWHELGHMVDFQHYLPPTMHPWRMLALLLRNGLSAARVAGEMEARAEVTALAKSKHPRLVLAHIAGFLVGNAGDSPHADGFRRLARRILREQRKRGMPAQGVARWHQADPAVIQAIGRQLLKEQW